VYVHTVSSDARLRFPFALSPFRPFVVLCSYAPFDSIIHCSSPLPISFHLDKLFRHKIAIAHYHSHHDCLSYLFIFCPPHASVSSWNLARQSQGFVLTVRNRCLLTSVDFNKYDQMAFNGRTCKRADVSDYIIHKSLECLPQSVHALTRCRDQQYCSTDGTSCEPKLSQSYMMEVTQGLKICCCTEGLNRQQWRNPFTGFQ